MRRRIPPTEGRGNTYVATLLSETAACCQSGIARVAGGCYSVLECTVSSDPVLPVACYVMPQTCESCGAHLSRYNDDERCAACAQAETSWRSPDVSDALASMDLGRMLSIIRHDAGLSQLEMGQILGWSASHVHRVEHGERQSLYDVRVLLQVCDALQMPRVVLEPLWRDAGAGGGDAMDMSRREFARAMLSAAALGALPAGGAGAETVVPARVDSAHVRSLRAAADRLYEDDQLVGGGALLEDAVQHLNKGRHMLNSSDFTERIGTQLMSAVGELAVCTGWLAFDSGNADVARALYLEAVALADEAGANDLGIRAREKLALLAVQTARLSHAPQTARQALRFTARAVHAASHAGPRVHALLLSREAVAHATLGDRDAYLRAVAGAWRELERDESDANSPVWLRFVTAGELFDAEAKGLVYLGDPSRAVNAFDRALAQTNSPRNALIYRAQRSTAIGLSGDVTEAVAEALKVLPALGYQVASPRTLRELSSVRTLAARAGNQDLVQQYDTAAARLAA